TVERVVLPDDLVARLEGKSSLGRLRLLIHSTAGYVDPGWDGNLTLELSNVANLPITLYYGMKIGQISFQQMSSPVEVAYGDSRIGSKYRGQRDPTASLYHRDFDRGRLLPGERSRNRGGAGGTEGCRCGAAQRSHREGGRRERGWRSPGGGGGG